MIDPELDLVMGGDLHTVQSECGCRSTLGQIKKILRKSFPRNVGVRIPKLGK